MSVLRITASSRKGQVRTNNEDMLLVGEQLIRNGRMSKTFSTREADRFMLAVADGMGGHNSGEVASADTLSNLRFYFTDLPVGLTTSTFNEVIYEWLASINNFLDAKGRCSEVYRNMGTTLVALAYYAGEFYWMNCGDSRLYRLHDGHLSQITTDHSLNTLLGESQHSNYITNCIGGGCKNSYIDVVKCTDIVQPGDTFLLCSDGLSDMLPDDKIASLLKEGNEADAICQAADDAGGRDNITVIVIHIE